MRVYNLIATEEHFDAKSGLITYKVSVEGSDQPVSGLIVLGPLGDTRDMVIMNGYYSGGELVVKMRPIKTPAKKYKVNEVVAQLVVP
jgi:hypothetical protein